MAPAFYVELHAGVHLGPAPPMLGCGASEAEHRIDHADRVCGLAEDRRRRRDCLGQVVKDLQLAGADPLLGAEHDRFPLF